MSDDMLQGTYIVAAARLQRRHSRQVNNYRLWGAVLTILVFHWLVGGRPSAWYAENSNCTLLSSPLASPYPALKVNTKLRVLMALVNSMYHGEYSMDHDGPALILSRCIC